MPTLNTLRTRGGIIVSVVIGIALLAFLLGDLSSTDGMLNARKTRVGEIDGNKIGYIEYSDQVDYYTRIIQAISGSGSLSTQQQEGVKDFAWEQLVNKYVLNPGFAKLGVNVSEAEQLDMVDGTYISPAISNMFTNPQTGIYSAEEVRQFVSTIESDPSGSRGAVWEYIKDQMDSERRMSKYIALIEKGMFVTDLEIEQSVARANTVDNISYVMQDYSLIADSTVVISKADIKKYYDEHKNLFRQTASRDIEYVLFDVLPSEQDYADAEKAVNEMADEFVSTDAPLQYATLNSQVQNRNSRMYLAQSQLEPAMADYAFGPASDKMYGPVLNETTYTIARVADRKMLPDSIGARHILLPQTETMTADSLVIKLKAGEDFAELASVHSIDEAANMSGGDLGIFPPERMVPEFSNALMEHKVGDIFLVTTQFGIHVVELTYKSKLSEKVQLAEIIYRIEPSGVTQQDIYADVSKFIGEAAGSYDNFQKAASDNGLTPRAVRVRNTDKNVSALEDSKELVRWAFTNEKGTVSPIIEIDGDYVVAALNGVTEDGISPLETVSTNIESILRTEKKGGMLSEKMQGASSLADLASTLGTEVEEANGIEFNNSFYVDGIGVEPKLIGAVAASLPNAVSKPVAGNSGVFVFEITSSENVENATFESEKVRMDAMSKAYVGERLNQAMLEESNVKDMRVKFF